MKKYLYQCSLLTDVVITSSAGSEGYKESLDYIPGSKFLGIAAKSLYDETNELKTLDLFHNSVVKFGDACIAINGESSYKIPFSWYHKKEENLSNEIFIHHSLSKADLEKFRANGVQLKQARDGYFSPTLKKFVAIEQDFAIKSAQDSETRKSKDSQMYGYYSLKKGSIWNFFVEDETGNYADEIRTNLEGKHRIGRSRSAEYGLIDIKFLNLCPLPAKAIYNDEVVLYAQSNLCFYNNGKSTAQPSPSQLVGTTKANILWEKCQVRSRNYKTWNRHRNNKDADRIIVEKGSVFVVQLKEELSSDFFENGIGAHKSEGFGKVIINPDFLSLDSSILPYSLEKLEQHYEEYYAKKVGNKDEEILSCLEASNGENNFDAKIDKLVNDFKKTYGNYYEGVSKSQWGALRNYGKNLDDSNKFKQLVFNPELGILYRGQSESTWRTKNRRGILEDFMKKLNAQSEYLPFIVKLSSLMAKKN